MRGISLLCAVIVLAGTAIAEFAPNRYALILAGPAPASAAAALAADRDQILARQRTLRAELAARQIQVTGSASTLLNAIFVSMPESRVAEVQGLPGVTAVVPLRRYRPLLNRAAGLVKAPAAWDAVGGASQSGAGLKIAVLDTGIDQTHPAFQDASLPMPSGFPRCSEGDCAYTNNKVIVARSYVRMLAAGTSPLDPAPDSRPDDYSARDREGHGTAVASAAAGVRNSGVVAISGIAPKAYLGNYKIYGSPQVNEFSYDDVIIQALEDAIADGMNVVSFSTGSPAFTGPLDTGGACGLPVGTPCDLTATAFEQAARAGTIIVAAAGSEGNDGLNAPTFHTISSPANAPSVIAVGATTNSHVFWETVSVLALDAPPNLRGIAAVFSGDSFYPSGAVSAPLRDVSQLGDNGLACSALPAGSLSGAFALILRGTCTFAQKGSNAVTAGALGVIFYNADQSTLPSPQTNGLAVPVVAISNADGLALKSYLAANADAPVAIDPNGKEMDYQSVDRLAIFSSLGPSTADYLVKPDLVAPGTFMYMATERFDPLGVMYSASRYVASSGTSFATPLVSGAAALVRQRRPNFTAAQVKSALVNTASQEVTLSTSGTPLTPQWVGAGKLDAAAAVNAVVTSDPATISFGVLKAGGLPLTRQIRITNTSTSPLALSVAALGVVSPFGTTVGVDKTSLTLAGNSSESVTATLSGALPAAGAYSGNVRIEGPGVLLRVPYQYFVSNGIVANLIGLAGVGFDRTVGESPFLVLRAIDEYGVPASGIPVTWTVQGDKGRISSSDRVTDSNGVALARAELGTTPGRYSFTGAAGDKTLTFSGSARAVPTINPGGVVNAASYEQSGGVAPGSYVAIFGSGLSDATKINSFSSLPMALDNVNVSFDVASAGISVPGRLTFVSPGQVNLQVPWELQGQSSVKLKVTIGFSPGNVVIVPLADYAPAFFEFGGIAAALDTGNRVISLSNHAVRGQVSQLFANGLGPVTNRPASGEPAPSSPLAETTTLPVVTIGGRQAQVQWSGLTPTLAGLYQMNVFVPADLPPGTHPITVSIGGKTSKTSNLPVR